MKRLLKFLCVICLMTATTLPARATLPAGYTELEYIESTGTQYIDTGYVMTSDVVEYGIKMWGRPINASSLFGSETNSGVKYTGIPYAMGTPIQLFIGSRAGFVSKTFPEDQWNTYIVLTTSATVGSVILNGETTAFSYTGGIQKVRPLWLFGNNNESGALQKTSAKVASFYIKDNNVMVRNFVPAKNASGVIGMYDTVNDVFYTNRGSGTFTAGPEVVPPEIKIATTKYTEEAFAGLVATLNSAIDKVTNIVDNTVQQATEIGVLAETKQDRPETDCPAGRKCLLIMGADNKPHWYLIQE